MKKKMIVISVISILVVSSLIATGSYVYVITSNKSAKPSTPDQCLDNMFDGSIHSDIASESEIIFSLNLINSEIPSYYLDWYLELPDDLSIPANLSIREMIIGTLKIKNIMPYTVCISDFYPILDEFIATNNSTRYRTGLGWADIPYERLIPLSPNETIAWNFKISDLVFKYDGNMTPAQQIPAGDYEFYAKYYSTATQYVPEIKSNTVQLKIT